MKHHNLLSRASALGPLSRGWIGAAHGAYGGGGGGGGGGSGAVIDTAGGLWESSGAGPVTFSEAPSEGELLVAMCQSYTGLPAVQAGWTQFTAVTVAANKPAIYAAYKYCGAGETASQTPFTGGGAAGVNVWRVSGAPELWANAFVNSTHFQQVGGTSVSASRTTIADNRLSLVMAFGRNSSSQEAYPVPTFSAGDYSTDYAATNGAATVTRIAAIAGHLECPASGTVQNATAEWGVSSSSNSIQIVTLALTA